MTKRNGTIRKITMVMVVGSLAQLQVWANLPKPGAGKSVAAPVKNNARLTGRLTADGPVTVNGNKARTGDTVFPGALIETLAGVGATIQLGALGQLDLSPATRLALQFEPGNIQGELSQGCVMLSAGPGVNGALRLPRGEWRRAEAGKTLNTCADGHGNELATGARSARVGRANGINLGGGSVSWYELSSLVAGAGVLTGGLRLSGTEEGGSGCCCCCCCGVGKNPSPSVPQP